MRVRVSGKQVQIGETLPAGVRARLEETVAKHFDGGADANVVFSHNGPFYRVDCTLHLDSSTIIKSEGEGPDAHRAFDTAFLHIERNFAATSASSRTITPRGRARAGAPA